jgi:uncharacterized protein (TIGR02611 family)
VTDNATDPVVDRETDEPSDQSSEHASDQPSDETAERGRIYRFLHSNPALALTTKIVVTLVGSLVLLAGVVMIFTPGQGILMIILGLAILATEYAWAARWLKKAKEKAEEAKRRAEQMDPKVRRRRLLIMGAVTVVVAAALVWYLAVYDWPMFAVDSWDWVQSLAGWVPDLPGM